MTRAYQYTSSYRGGRPFDPYYCAASVSDKEAWSRSHQCKRKPVVEEDGNKWCKQHAPSSEKLRHDESMQRWADKMANTPWARLIRLQGAIDDYKLGHITFDRLLEIRYGKG